MFGLPIETALLVFGFPAFWIAYTIVFFARTREWDDDVPKDDGPVDDGPGADTHGADAQ